MLYQTDGVVRAAAGRRAALARIAALCGLALSGDALAALAAVPAPGLFNPDQLALTGVLAEMIIPATDTPGALAAGVHHAIGRLLLDCESAANQRRFVAGLARLDTVAGVEGGAGFAALPAARRGELMAMMEAGGAPFTNTDKRFFIQIKALTVFAYCTSEAGATLALSYLPVPGGYQGDVPLARVGRAWAL